MLLDIHPARERAALIMRGGGKRVVLFVFALTLLALCETSLCDDNNNLYDERGGGTEETDSNVVVSFFNDDGRRSGGETKIASKGKDVPWNKVEEQSRFFIKGYPKYAIWRTFDAIEVTLKDIDGSVKANQCALKVGIEEEVLEEEEGKRTAKNWQYRRLKMKREEKKKKNEAYTHGNSNGSKNSRSSSSKATKKSPSTLIANMSPFQEKSAVYVLQCNPSGGKSNGKVTYEITVREYFDSNLFLRFVGGISSMTLAPVIATSPWCFYIAAMSLSTAMLLCLVLLQLTRLTPSGRATRTFFGISSTLMTTFAYHFVPVDKWKIVLEYLWKGMSKPIRASWGVLRNADPDEPKTIYIALLVVGFFLVSSGLGVMFVKKWVVDDRSGEVVKGWKQFTSFSISVFGVIMLKFCTRDAQTGNTLALLAGSTIVAGPAAAFAKDVKRTLRLAFHAFTFHLFDKKKSSDDRKSFEYDDEFYSDEEEETEYELRRRLPATMDPEPRVAPSPFTPLEKNADSETRNKRSSSLSPFSLVRNLNPFSGGDKSEPATPQPTPGGGSSSDKKTTKSSNSGGKKKSPPPFSTTTSNSNGKDKKRMPPVGLASNSRGRFLSAEEADELETESTNAALKSLARSPEFALWLTKNASRIRVINDEREELKKKKSRRRLKNNA